MLISIIIPAKNKLDISGLFMDIDGQKITFDREIIKIANISPSARARNLGVRQARGDMLVFFDEDIRLGGQFLLQNLVQPLMENKSIGATCSSIRLPAQATRFQMRYAREIPHSQTPIVERLTDVSVVSSAACAIYKEVFFKIGGFNEKIIRGEDSLFSWELRKQGYRTVLAAHAWCYHPQPDNLHELFGIQFRNGRGAAFVDNFYPFLNIDVDPRGIIYPVKIETKRFRIKRFCWQFLVSIFSGKVLFMLAKLSYAMGYLYGLLNNYSF